MQNGTLRDCCVVDAGNLYRAFVTVQTEQMDGAPTETVLARQAPTRWNHGLSPPPLG